MEMTLDLPAIFELEKIDDRSYQILKETAFASKESLNRFRELMAELEQQAAADEGSGAEGAALKLGMCHLLLGQSDLAAEWLGKAQNCAEKFFYLGLVYQGLRQYAEAVSQFESAAQGGADCVTCDSHRAECYILTEEYDRAKEILDSCREIGEASARWHFVMGRYWCAVGDLDRAIESYEAALEKDEDHIDTLFHLAYLLRLHGSDQRAKEINNRLMDQATVHISTLMNLAVIFEDECEYDKAANCLRRILAVDPNHSRAQLYLKDVLSATEMYIDEQQMIDEEKRNAVLDIPVSDFELSVRSRNCLKKMNINTLGDLLKTSEAVLLSYKNFGETSLKEIRIMLKQKGLSLGQLADSQDQDSDGLTDILEPSTPSTVESPSNPIIPAVPADPFTFSPSPDSSTSFASSAPLDSSVSSDSDPLASLAHPAPPVQQDVSPEELPHKPVSTLDLSVRSRKCLQSLGIVTIGDLLQHKESELLGSRNFGETSLNEIKNCIAQLGLSFADES